jgi:hypothetical protein
MSSGALLLKELQARADRRHASSNGVSSRAETTRTCNDDADGAGHDDARTTVPNAGSACTDDEDRVLNPQQNDKRVVVPNNEHPVTIEVCLGPDCSGGGGGAALLEIESLVMMSQLPGEPRPSMSNRSRCNIRVVGGGCRDFCTMGPNVHIHSDSIAAEDSHLTKVDCPAECRRVVRVATEGKGEYDANVSECDNAAVGRILQLREDGQRWRTLREQAAKERRLRVREREKKDATD